MHDVVFGTRSTTRARNQQWAITMRTSFCVVLAIAACGNDHGKSNVNPDASTPPGGSTVVYLTPIQHLTRASLALRGVRPSLQDLQDVNADPSQLSAKVDGYLETPEFGAMIMDLHNEDLLLRIEYPLYVPNAAPALPDATTFTDMAGSFNEPLQLIRDVVMTNQPYSNIVTAPYTMANTIVAGMWQVTPTTPPTDTTTWVRATWNDGRPAAGILSTSILWQRWMSAGFNFDRGRANMVSRALLCHDFLESDIAVDTSVDLADPEVVAKAVQTEPVVRGLPPDARSARELLLRVRADAQQTFNSCSGVDLRLERRRRWFGTNYRPPGYFGEAPTGSTGSARRSRPTRGSAQCAAIHFATLLDRGLARSAPGRVGRGSAEPVRAEQPVGEGARKGDRAVRSVSRRVRHRSDEGRLDGRLSQDAARAALAHAVRPHRLHVDDDVEREDARRGRLDDLLTTTSTAFACSPAASIRTS